MIETASNMPSNARYLANKAVNMFTTLRSAGHRSVDGAMVGGVLGLVTMGPLGVLPGMQYGGSLGFAYGFCEASNTDFDRAAQANQQRQYTQH
jgi:hypothetical protein